MYNCVNIALCVTDHEFLQLIVLRAELEMVNSENRRLKETLSQVTQDFHNIQMHLLIQQQQYTDQNASGRANEEQRNGHGNSSVAPRQFMELGLASPGDNEDTTSEGRDHPSVPDKDIILDRDQSPENKVPRLTHSPRSVDQAAEATMRKCRVSVRLRSEAPMVHMPHLLIKCYIYICVSFGDILYMKLAIIISSSE